MLTCYLPAVPTAEVGSGAATAATTAAAAWAGRCAAYMAPYSEIHARGHMMHVD